MGKYQTIMRWINDSPRGAAVLLGMCVAFSLPPFYFSPLFIVGIVGIDYLIRPGTSWREAMVRGFLWGLGIYVISLHWSVSALRYEFDKFWWLTPFALFGLPSYLSAYCALAAVVVAKSKLTGFVRILLWAALLTLMDLLRSYAFTGFPWNLFGHVWVGMLWTRQIIAIIGIYGLGFLGILWALCVPSLFMPYIKPGKVLRLLAIAIPLMVLGFGAWRTMDPTYSGGKHVIRLVQPCIAQEEKLVPGNAFKHMGTLLALSARPASVKLDGIIWPEGAFPHALPKDMTHFHFLPHLGVNFWIIAMSRYTENASHQRLYTNSIVVLDSQNNVQSYYDKKHLLPFGEYIPLRSIFPLPSVASDRLDFGFGEGPITLQTPNGPSISALICYDAIFPRDAADPCKRPDILVNLTNDAWFAYSFGPEQHLEMVRVRAVEEGLPMVRVANNGITALIDPYGRTLASLPYNYEGILDVCVPEALPTTFYSQWGFWIDGIFLILGILAVGVGLGRVWPRGRL